MREPQGLARQRQPSLSVHSPEPPVITKVYEFALSGLPYQQPGANVVMRLYYTQVIPSTRVKWVLVDLMTHHRTSYKGTSAIQ
jgi:hypothetical protein